MSAATVAKPARWELDAPIVVKARLASRSALLSVAGLRPAVWQP